MARYRNATTLEMTPELHAMYTGELPPPYRQDNAARTELECLRAEVQFLRELVKNLTRKSEPGQ